MNGKYERVDQNDHNYCNSCGKHTEVREFPMEADVSTSWEICKINVLLMKSLELVE